MTETADVDQRIREIQREYLDFLDDEADQGKYAQLVKNMVSENSKRLIININDLRRKNPTRVQSLLNNSFEEQIAFQNALKEYIFTVAHEYGKDNEDFFVGYEGSFGSKLVTPRTLHARFLGNLISVEGIVTKCSSVHPKVVKSVHYCPATHKITERKYTDLTSLDAFPSSTVYPTQDEDGNALETEYGLSNYKNHQTISIQEMPEKAPAGQLPRSVDIICDNDLVDACKPGDRIQIVGNYRCLPNKHGNFTNCTFRSVLIASNVLQLSKEANSTISREDVAKCKSLAKSSKDIFSLLAKSLAPSICGHTYIKKAILCLLLGGMEKILPNGTRLRGDINILLIGDPSVAKSQLLRYVLGTAPRAVATTGRGSSGVGLTAAVTTDQETGERRLEAGAMVLADRGVVCIDEFDKMSDMDRTAIHEVMEQGRVTVAKAGIHASLNARCSVLAAANPVYGKYNQYKTPMENIGLQDSLLSRFDLIFVMLDNIDEDHDLMIADHVARMHRWRNPAEQDGDVLPMGSGVDILNGRNTEASDEVQDAPIYEKYDPLLHGSTRSRTDKILTIEFMRKYINFVKIMKPVLTEEASEIIADEYSRLRSEDVMDSDVARTQPVTPRTLETMIRLATAHAKARMSRTIDEVDANAALELVQYAYFKKVLEKEKRKRRRDSADYSSGDSDNDDQTKRKSKRAHADNDSDEEVITSQRSTRSRSQPREPVTNGNGVHAEEAMDVDGPSSATIEDERLALFKTSLFHMFRENRVQTLSLIRIREGINSQNTGILLTNSEIDAAIVRMSEDNQVMLADGILFLI